MFKQRVNGVKMDIIIQNPEEFYTSKTEAYEDGKVMGVKLLTKRELLIRLVAKLVGWKLD